MSELRDRSDPSSRENPHRLGDAPSASVWLQRSPSPRKQSFETSQFTETGTGGVRRDGPTSHIRKELQFAVAARKTGHDYFCADLGRTLGS